MGILHLYIHNLKKIYVKIDEVKFVCKSIPSSEGPFLPGSTRISHS